MDGRSSLFVVGLATAIDIPLEDWPGNCYAVATAIAEAGLVEGKPEYGVWHGPIAEGSHFEGRPIARHGWIRQEDGTVVDPTRWVFENVEPYIYRGPADYYDLGGSDLRQKVLGTTHATESQVLEFLEDPEGCDEDMLRLFAHTPPKEHPFFMAEVYEEIIKLGRGVLIPIDFREWAGL